MKRGCCLRGHANGRFRPIPAITGSGCIAPFAAVSDRLMTPKPALRSDLKQTPELRRFLPLEQDASDRSIVVANCHGPFRSNGTLAP